MLLDHRHLDGAPKALSSVGIISFSPLTVVNPDYSAAVVNNVSVGDRIKNPEIIRQVTC